MSQSKRLFDFQSPIDILSSPFGGFSKMLFSKSATRMGFQIGLKSSRLFFTVESNSGLNFPRLQWSGMRNCTAVMSGEAFLQVCRISYVVMCLCGYIGENINIEKGLNKGSRIRMMVRCSTIVDATHTSFCQLRRTPLSRLGTTPWHFSISVARLRSVGFAARRYCSLELHRGIFQ